MHTKWNGAPFRISLYQLAEPEPAWEDHTLSIWHALQTRGHGADREVHVRELLLQPHRCRMPARGRCQQDSTPAQPWFWILMGVVGSTPSAVAPHIFAHHFRTVRGEECYSGRQNVPAQAALRKACCARQPPTSCPHRLAQMPCRTVAAHFSAASCKGQSRMRGA